IVNKAACEHFDGFVGTTDADLMLFEVARKVTGPGGSTVLFEPGAGAPATSTPLALPLINRVGFLIVEPNNPATNTALFGTAAVIDGASGLAWSYTTNFSSSSVVPNPNFSAIDGGKYSGGAPVGPGGGGTAGFKHATGYPT